MDSCLDAFLFSELGLTLYFLEVVKRSEGCDPSSGGKHHGIITADDCTSTMAEVGAPSLGMTATTFGTQRSSDQEKTINN